MESLSAIPCRGLVPWPGLLLAVSLITFWSPPTTAQLAIVPTFAAEGSDVVMRIKNKPPNFWSYVWYKGQGANFNNFIASVSKYPLRRKSINERVLVEYDGYLHIKRVTLRDAGDYTIVVYLLNGRKEIGFGQLTVYEPLRVPTLLASNTSVTENKDAVEFTCYTNGITTDWLFNAVRLKLTERMKLSPDNRVLTIDPVRREDAGSYQCEVSNPQSSTESWPVELNVKYD
ncbi:carcinoembryonic antigen-related cell adhesion molecule 21-like [Saccopteryx bilineata]|uniref:carcinoembryonic antigen-related cell adhesion molecule 21-like n=1 Tax=Saccopteryx bilineata TaxID=59482 RepID=UPI00338F4C0F